MASVPSADKIAYMNGEQLVEAIGRLLKGSVLSQQQAGTIHKQVRTATRRYL